MTLSAMKGNKKGARGAHYTQRVYQKERKEAMEINVRIGFDDKAQNLLFGLYESMGRLMTNTEKHCTKCESTKAQKAEPVAEEVTKEEAKKVEEMFKLEDVRAVFIRKNTRENRKALTDILTARGVDKVSQLDPKDFAGVLEDLGALPDA